MCRIDYDHDYDLDLVLLGEKSVLLRNQGPAGFQPVSFPFVSGRALSGVTFRVVPGYQRIRHGRDVRRGEGVLYRDLLQGRYTAEKIALPANSRNVAAADLNNDGWLDLVYTSADGTLVAWNKEGQLSSRESASRPLIAPSRSQTWRTGASLDVVQAGAVLRNDRKGGFARQSAAGLPAECAAWAVRDFDNDGRMDLACGRSSS